jgi:hypothetical protein
MRSLVLILLAGWIFGCSTTPSNEPFRLNAAQKYAQEVLMACDEFHRHFEAGKSPVDCWYQYPRVLVMSFHSAHYHDQHLTEVGKVFNHWCASVEGATGELPSFTRIFRQDQMTQGLPCKNFKEGRK